VIEPRAFVTVDSGTATTGVALIAGVEGRWRLLGAYAAPASVAPEPIIELLSERLGAADPALAAALDTPAVEWRRLSVRTAAPPRLAVVAGSERTLGALVGSARHAGWDALGLSVANADTLAMSRLLLRGDVSTVLAGAADPAGGDERGALPELAALLAAARVRRPELTIVLAGAMAEHEARIAGADGSRRAADDRDPATDGSGGGVLLAPAPTAGEPTGEPLRHLLGELGASLDDGRRATVRAVTTLASVLDRTVEAVDVGRSAGLRVVVAPGAQGSEPRVRWAVHPDGALVPPTISDEVVDGVLAWSVVALDRHRMRDRLRELRDTPWGEPHGDGALLRLAAARAAVARLVAATPDVDPSSAPDLVIAAGGAWAVAPGPAIALALSDVLRRPGASQLAFDHARLLGPLGSIEDPRERRRMVADLADDLLAPLGGVVVPAGLRPGRSAGRLVVHASGGSTELDLVPGGLELVDLPPGESAIAELQFRDPVALGTRGRRFALELGGGLGGLLIDLRDVPLRLPDRLERRRELLGAWQQSLWAGLGQDER
jgi:hypothetical protein